MTGFAQLRSLWFWLLALALVWLISTLLAAWRTLPAGLAASMPVRAAEQVELLIDQTWQDSAGQSHSEQEIFDEVLRLIGQARRLVVLDMFLFNEFAGADSYRALTRELTQALLEARRRQPDMPVILITDPFNTLYGGVAAAHLQQLEAAGVQVLISNLAALPASNPVWTGLWQLCCRYLDNSQTGGWLPNPVGAGKVTLRSYLHLLNFRANHRKTLVVDEGQHWTGLVTSANPHDGSSRHSNQALVFRGPAALDLLETERAIINLSAPQLARDWPLPPAATPINGDATVQILTEGAIRDQLLQLIDSAQPGEQLDLEVFYLSHRPMIQALIAAHQRGVQVRVMLDPNRDAFGREKNGIPNRQAAWDLHRAGIELRWCATHGEQCHRKWLLLRRADGSAALLSGSANFTRRNLDNLNPETSVLLDGPAEHPALSRAARLFERHWHNQQGQTYSLPYVEFADHSRWRYWLYRLMEASGLSTF